MSSFSNAERKQILFARVALTLTRFPCSTKLFRVRRQTTYLLVTALGTTLLAARPAYSDQPTDKLNDTAQQAFDDGKFRKAANGWVKAIKSMEDAGQKDLFFEGCLKRLGQAYKKLQLTVEAYKTLKQAFDMCNQLGVEDKELATELSDLSTSYRPVDVNQLGPKTAEAFKKANVTDIGLTRNSDNGKLQVNLEDRFEKHLDNDTVDGIAMDKQVTMEINEASDGTVNLNNIKGFRIHAKEKDLWVSLLQAVIKPADPQGEHPAEVTAGKMGVTKTVAATLPAKGFEPLGQLLEQFKAMVTPMVVRFTNPAAGANSSTQSATVSTQSATSAPQSTTASTQSTASAPQSTTASTQSTASAPQSTTASTQSTPPAPQSTTASNQATSASPQSASSPSTPLSSESSASTTQSTSAMSQSTSSSAPSTTASNPTTPDSTPNAAASTAVSPAAGSDTPMDAPPSTSESRPPAADHPAQ